MADYSKRKLTRAQRYALLALVKRNSMTLDQFVKVLEQGGEDIEAAAMSVELLMLYGLIAPRIIPGQVSGEVSATLRLQAWYRQQHASPQAIAPKPARRLRVPYRPPLRSLTSLAVATALAAGCANLNLPTAEEAQVTAQPRTVQMASYYQNNMVYRYCQGPECLEPTPKVPAAAPLTRPRTTTVDMPGAPMPATQDSTQEPPPLTGMTPPPSTKESFMAAEILRLREALAKLESAVKLRDAPTVATTARPVTPAPSPLTPQRVQSGQPTLASNPPATPRTPSVTDTPTATSTPQPERAPALAAVAAPKAMDIAKPVVKVAASEPVSIGLKLDADFASFKAIVQFEDGAQTLDGLSREKIAEIAPKAKLADKVRVRGYAAVAQLDETTRKLALGRAIAVRNALVAHEVSPAKVQILNPQNRLLDPAHPTSRANRAVAIDVVMPAKTSNQS